MIYETKKWTLLAEKAGVTNVDKFSNRFLPTLILPVFLIKFNILVALCLLFILLRLPQIVLFYLSKERHKRILMELPLFVSSLNWMLTIHPIQKALGLVNFGEISKIFNKVSERYEAGEDFDKALKYSELFPELSELSKRLRVIYSTGEGEEMLELFADKIASKNFSRIKKSSSKMELFAVAYTTISSVFPAVYSGINLQTGNMNMIYVALAASMVLVILWKLID